jgi:hypothetical protein
MSSVDMKLAAMHRAAGSLGGFTPKAAKTTLV